MQRGALDNTIFFYLIVKNTTIIIALFIIGTYHNTLSQEKLLKKKPRQGQTDNLSIKFSGICNLILCRQVQCIL